MKTLPRRLFCNILLAIIHLNRQSVATQPNILFILADDVGWSDFSYNVRDSPIPTPYIDSMAEKGIALTQYYTHSLCTPSRAALLTGKYHVNTGLNFVLIPGSPAGLRDNLITLPEMLRSHANYSTSIVGKWHLGHAQRKLTPVGRGFESFTGIIDISKLTSKDNYIYYQAYIVGIRILIPNKFTKNLGKKH
jgi:arylsulfatase A-like enzyme